MRAKEALISVNSDYIVLRGDDSAHLFLGDKLVWSKSEFNSDIRLLSLGNNGALLTYEQSQVSIINPDGSRTLALQSNVHTVLNKAVMDGQGRLICVEMVHKTDPTGKKKSGLFFRSSEREVPARFHKIVVHDALTGQENEIWDFESNEKNEGTLVWDISKDFTLLAIGETSWVEKPAAVRVTRIYVIQLREDKSLLQISLTNADLKALHLNEKGMLIIELRDGGRLQFLLASQTGEKISINPPLRNLKLLHFGKDTLIFQTLPEKVLLFKDFKDNLSYVFDERVLETVGLGNPVIFKSNDDMVMTSFDPDRSILKRYVYTWRASRVDFLYHK